jgi:hypothetical protein
MARPSDHQQAYSAVHSEREIGFEQRKISARSLSFAIERITWDVKSPGMALTPMLVQARISRTRPGTWSRGLAMAMHRGPPFEVTPVVRARSDS